MYCLCRFPVGCSQLEMALAQDTAPPGHANLCLCCRPTRCTPSEGAPDQPQSTHWRSVLCIHNHRCCVPPAGTALSISSDLSSLTGLLCTDFQHKTALCFVEVLILTSNNHLLPLRSPATCKPHLVPHATIACLYLCSPGIRSCGLGSMKDSQLCHNYRPPLLTLHVWSI